NQQLDMVSVVRDTVRVGATHRHEWSPGPADAARAAARAGLTEQGWNPDRATIDVQLVGAAPDQRITVTISTPYTAVFGVVPAPTAVRAAAVMRMQDQP